MLKTISNLKERNRVIFDLSIIFLISILATIPMYIYGIAGGNDMYQHFQFAQTFYDAIMRGDYYPSWAMNPNFGVGDVSVRFYPPLTYYSLSLFRFITGNWFDATCLHVAFLFCVSGIGVYLWSREWFSHNASLAGAITFIFVPYHFNQVYQAAMLAEFTAAAFLPFCFLFITRVCRQGKLIDMCGLAVSFSLLILSHLPTLLMASLIFSVYALFSLKKDSFIKSIFKLSASVLGSLILSSFYWVRMATELNFVKHNSDTFITDYFSYKANFALSYLFPFIERSNVERMSFVNLMLLITLGALLSNALIYFVNARKEKSYPITNVVVMTAFAILMIIPLSIPIWEIIPLVQKIQFPWRWLILISLGTAVFVSAGFDPIVNYFKSSQRYLSILALGCLLLFIPYNTFRIMSHLFFYPKDYFNSVVEKFKETPSNECWWAVWTPKSTSQEGNTGLPRPEMIPGKIVLNNRNFTVENWSPSERNLTIQAGESGQAVLATMYYPLWKATVNGQPIEVVSSETGLISFSVPAEESQIRVYLEQPSYVLWSFYISGFAWILIFCSLLLLLFYPSKPPQKESEI